MGLLNWSCRYCLLVTGLPSIKIDLLDAKIFKNPCKPNLIGVKYPSPCLLHLLTIFEIWSEFITSMIFLLLFMS